MKRFILIVSILFSSVSCDNLANNNSNDLVARAGQNFLYTNDLPVFESKDDSLRKFLNFIESWAKEKVLYDLSLVNLSPRLILTIISLAAKNAKIIFRVMGWKENSSTHHIMTSRLKH